MIKNNKNKLQIIQKYKKIKHNLQKLWKNLKSDYDYEKVFMI